MSSEWMKTALRQYATPTGEPLFLGLTQGQWYDSVASATPYQPREGAKDITKNMPPLEEMQKLYDFEVKRYQKYKIANPSSDQKWVNDIIKAGTLSDKVAALALIVQESPYHNLSALDALVAMALKKEQRTATLAIDALKDLLVHNLLPDRHLIPFTKQDWSVKPMTLQLACVRWFEDQLIGRMSKFVEAVEIGLKSSVDYFKKRCIDTAVDLLAAKPEKEAQLLAIVVNKLGDPSKSICSKSMESLKTLLRAHPAMKSVVVREVRQLITWSNHTVRIMYVSVVFLTQISLTSADAKVSAELVECYMSLFEKAIKHGEVGSRLLSVLLNGVNKAYPFLANTQPLEQQVDALFRIVHTASFTAATQALLLISFIALGDSGLKRSGGKGHKSAKTEVKSTDENELTNRYYRALYAKIVDDHITTKTRNTVFFNLLFRSLKRDPSKLRCAAFIKRLCMMTVHCNPSIATALLLLVAEVLKLRKDLSTMMVFDSRSYPEEEIAGKITPSESITQAKSQDGDEDANDYDKESQKGNQFDSFDALKREPLFAAAAAPISWEMSLLLHHFHPSVAAFAKSVTTPPHEIGFTGDPSSEFSITAFLNRFAYKNPKKTLAEKAASAGAPSTVPSGSIRTQLQEEPINTVDFSELSESDVSPEKLFFYKYFGDRQRLREEGKSRNRSRRLLKEDAGLDLDGDAAGDAEFGDSERAHETHFDDEAEIDAFADKLALDMMKAHDKNFDDPDIDDFDYEDDDDDDDNDDFDEQNEFEDVLDASDDEDNNPDYFDRSGGEEEPDEDSSEEDVTENVALEFEDFLNSQVKAKKSMSDSIPKAKSQGKAKKYVLQAYGDDDGGKIRKSKFDENDDYEDDDDVDIFAEDRPGRIDSQEYSAGKKAKSSKKTDMSDFADAADYEDDMEAIVQAHSLVAAEAALRTNTKKSKLNNPLVVRKPGLYDVSDIAVDNGQKDSSRQSGKRSRDSVLASNEKSRKHKKK